MTKTVLIMAGGTGGHVFPALAIADELRSRDVNIFWIGTQRGIESTLVPNAGYPITYISVQGLRGNGVLGWLLAPFKVIKAVMESVTAIKDINPDVVLGLGGFASGPGGVAAKLKSIPLVIHEQNAIPGLTNSLLSRLAKHVLQGFENSFPKSRHALWVGNPVRQSIEGLMLPDNRYSKRLGALNILVLGGSLGARSLNTILPHAFSLLTSDNVELNIKHQCGQRHLEDCQAQYTEKRVAAEIIAFIDDMAGEYARADLVICRAGALTVAEVSAAGVASILIPYPHAVDDHQTHNASVLVNVGAAELIQEAELSAEVIAQKLMAFNADRSTLLTMAKAARSQAKLGTAKHVADLCLEVIHE